MPEHEDIYSPAFVTHRERLKKDPTGVPKARVGLLARSHWHPQMSLMEGPGMGVGRPSQRWTLGVSSGKDSQGEGIKFYTPRPAVTQDPGDA